MSKKEKNRRSLNFKLIAIPALGILAALIVVVLMSAMSIIKTAEQFAKMQGAPVVEKVFNHIDNGCLRGINIFQPNRTQAF